MTNKDGKLSHGGNVWAASNEWGMGPERFIDYSANINPLGTCSESIEAIRQSLDLLNHYPEPAAKELHIALAGYLGINRENLVLGNGGSELIYLLSRMYYQNRVLLLAPTFSEYGEGIDKPQICEIKLNAGQQFKLPTGEIIRQMGEGDLLFVGYPNNPTGNLFPREDLLTIIDHAAVKNAVVVIDEAFIDFTGDETLSMRNLALVNEHVIVVGSLTKFFAIPALRLGYAVATKENIMQMEKSLPPWRINTLAQAAALAAINNQRYISDTIQLIREERAYLDKGLSRIKGLVTYSSDANFILVDGEGTGVTAEELQARLGPKGILIRQCHNFNNLSPYYFRLAVKKRQENIYLLECLQKVLS